MLHYQRFLVVKIESNLSRSILTSNAQFWYESSLEYGTQFGSLLPISFRFLARENVKQQLLLFENVTLFLIQYQKKTWKVLKLHFRSTPCSFTLFSCCSVKPEWLTLSRSMHKVNDDADYCCVFWIKVLRYRLDRVKIILGTFQH